MAFTPSPEAAFVEKWNKEAVEIYQQTESKFAGKTTEIRDKTKTLHVPKFESTDAVSGKSRHQQVTITAQSTEDITVTATPIYKAYMIDDWDAAQSSYDYRSILSKQAANAVRRGFDDIIIAAFNASTNSEITLPTANTLNYAGVVKLGETLDLSEVPEEDRYLATSPGGMTDLLNDTTVINNFHFKNDAVSKGMLPGIAGFDVFKTNRLPNGAAGSTERRVFGWHKGAVYTLIPQDFRVTISFENLHQGYALVASMMVGAKIHQQEGVQFADVTN